MIVVRLGVIRKDNAKRSNRKKEEKNVAKSNNGMTQTQILVIVSGKDLEIAVVGTKSKKNVIKVKKLVRKHAKPQHKQIAARSDNINPFVK